MTGAHVHEYIEILYCLAGQFEVYLNGIKHLMSSGDMVIINAMEVHHILALSESGGRYIVVKFEPELLYSTPRTIFETKYVLPFTLSSSTHNKVFLRESIEQTQIPSMIEEIHQEFRDKAYGFELSIQSNICKLFLWVLRKWHEQGIDLNIGYNFYQESMDRIQLIFDYVSKHYKEDLSVKSMSKLCNMSYSYFSRFFKSVMKKSFTEYLNYVRLSEAERLLTTTNQSITDIAMEVGFSTTSYFIAQFKAFKSTSPKQFRKKLVKNN